jgi:hypothetical protein
MSRTGKKLMTFLPLLFRHAVDHADLFEHRTAQSDIQLYQNQAAENLYVPAS